MELVHWDGILVHDGVLGGSPGSTLRRWDRSRNDNSAFNKDIFNAMSSTRWLELKRAMKLNNNMTATKHDEPNHNPCQKCDCIWDVLIHNTNALTKSASLDLCGDETTWLFAGWAEKDFGVVKRGLEKPGGSKEGQTVVVTDVDRIRVRAHAHRHKLHHKHFGHEGCNEVKMIADLLLRFVKNDTHGADDNYSYQEDYFKPKPLFSDPPHITWDNFFSGDNSIVHLAEKGFGFTSTVNRGRLPGKVPMKHWHKQSTGAGDPRPKAARHENPIVAMKGQPDKWGNTVWVHTSFQLTGPCNISHVNAMNSCSLFAQQKQRGRAIFKRTSAIKMNESRKLHLATYGEHFLKLALSLDLVFYCISSLLSC